MSDGGENRIEQASQGDPIAVEELLAEHLPGLRAFVRLRAGRLVLQQESAGDVVQSACRDILENLSRFEHGGPVGFRRWLYRTALRKIADRYDYYRAAKRDVGRASPAGSSEAPSPMPSPSEHAMAQEQADRVEAALDLIPEDYREVIVLSRYAGLSHAEIGEEMGRSQVAVRSLLSRALAQLAEELERTRVE